MQQSDHDGNTPIYKSDIAMMYVGGKNVRMWHLKQARCVAGISPAHLRFVRRIIRLPGDKLAIAANRYIYIWDILTRNLIRRLDGHAESVRSLVYMSDTQLVSCSWDRTLRVWDYESGTILKVIPSHDTRVMDICRVSENIVVSVSEDKECKVWDISSGRCIQRLVDKHNNFVNCVIKVGKTIMASGGADTVIKLWSYITGRCIRTLNGHDGSVYCLLFVPVDTKHVDTPESMKTSPQCILSGSFDKTIRLWDISTGNRIRTFTGHTREVVSLAYLSYRTFASGSNDCTVRIWDTFNGTVLKCIENQSDPVKSIYIDYSRRNVRTRECTEQIMKRFEFIVKNADIMFGLQIKFAQTTLKVPRALVAPYAQYRDKASDTWTFPHSVCSVTTRMLTCALFGIDNEIEYMECPEKVVELYVFFQTLGMVKHMYVLLKRLERITDIPTLIKILLKANNTFKENEDVDAPLVKVIDSCELESILESTEQNMDMMKLTFNTAFTLQVFNVLKRYITDIKMNPNYSKGMERLHCLSKLMSFESTPIESHSDFYMHTKSIETMHTPTFESLYAETVRMLHEEHIHTNLSIHMEKSSEHFAAHKEVLIRGSNFFYKIIQFGGVESKTVFGDGTLEISSVDGETLRGLIHYIYTGELDSTLDLYTLLSELTVSEMYDELDFTHKLLRRITKLMGEAYKENMLEVRILELGGIIHDLSDATQNDIIIHCASQFGISREAIRNLIQFSVRILDMVEDNDDLRVKLSKVVEKRKRGEEEETDLVTKQSKRRKLAKGTLKFVVPDIHPSLESISDDENADTILSSDANKKMSGWVIRKVEDVPVPVLEDDEMIVDMDIPDGIGGNA